MDQQTNTNLIGKFIMKSPANMSYKTRRALGLSSANKHSPARVLSPAELLAFAQSRNLEVASK